MSAPIEQPERAPQARVYTRAPRLLPLYVRAAAALLPGARRLPGARGAGATMPVTELVLASAAIDRNRLAAYREATCFDPTERVPPTYPHVVAFPLHMELMTSPRFPFPAIGLVHIENEIVQLRPLLATEPLELAVRATGPGPHARGRTCTIHTTACVAGEPVWEEWSVMLSRGRSGERAPAAAPAAGADAGNGEPGTPAARAQALTRAEWATSRDVGRRYAAASGDRNPIHTSALGAKAFGFPGPIAHGMWAKARCLAALADDLPGAFGVRVRFRKPLLLGARASFAAERAGERVRFRVRAHGGDAVHLEGSLEPLVPGAADAAHDATGAFAHELGRERGGEAQAASARRAGAGGR